MNRIKLSPLAAEPDTSVESRPSSPRPPFSLSPSTRSDSELSLFVPLHYERNYAYPLVVWLHAGGRSTSNLQDFMTRLSTRNYVGVAPLATVGNFECGYYWEQDYDGIQSAEEAVNQAIQHAESRLNIARHRIFLAGADDGATMALRIALQRPQTFAGVIALNGPLPTGQAPFSQWSECRNLPVFWSHHTGTDSAIEDMCDSFRFLYSAGFLNLTAREYPAAEYLHQLAPAAIDQWIMEQISSAIL